MDQEEMDLVQFECEIDRQLETKVKKRKKKVTEEILVGNLAISLQAEETPTPADDHLAMILKSIAVFIKNHARDIVKNDSKVIDETCHRIQRMLLCISSQTTHSEINNAYFKILDALEDVRFPVTSIVNHVMVSGLRYMGNMSEYFSDIATPTDTTKLKYFLKHAHDPEEGFSLDGFRFSDFLLVDFFRQDCPRALLEILRYGCSDLLKKKSLDIKRFHLREVGAMIISEYKLLDTLEFFISWASRCVPETPKEIQAKADCLKIIFRSVYMFSFEQLYVLSDFDEEDNVLKPFTAYGLNFLTGIDRFPELNERLGKTAPSLKHLCRFEIRKALYKNWALPDGIKSLGLPFNLEEYLDLKTD